MKIRFANSAWVHASEHLVLAGGRRHRLALPVRYGIVEHPDGLTLVDAGYGPAVTRGKRSLTLRLYAALFGPDLIAEGAPLAVLARLGYQPADVARIVVTHFHADHISTLRDFPAAQVLARRRVLDRILTRSRGANTRRGLFPELLPADIRHRMVDIDTLPEAGTPLGPGRDLLGDGSALTVDLPGHAEGHFGLFFPAPNLLYAVDAQWLLAALPDRLPGFPAALIAEDGTALADTARRVAAFRAGGGLVVLCHDPAPTEWDL